jgi:peptidoglycan/xylan/chitin deacetylase (PgdA/CDA1 family)
MRRLGRLASAAARGAEVSGFIRLLEATIGSRRDRLGVLTYHRVTEADAHPRPAPGTLSATPAAFALQMEFLARSYRLVSIQDLLDVVRQDRALPPRSLLLTFDDAYVDFEEEAWPILRRAGLPVTLFVPTGYPDRPERSFWWDRLFQAIVGSRAERIETPRGPMVLTMDTDRLQAYRLLREGIKGMPHAAAMDRVDQICRELGDGHPAPGVLSWSSLRTLANEGVALGAHSRSHPLVDRIPIEEAREEILGSMEDLRRETGLALPVFAYPGGHYNDEVARLVQGSNVRLAFTTDPGVNDIRRSDPMRLRRIHVGGGTSLAVLRAQLLGIRRPS